MNWIGRGEIIKTFAAIGKLKNDIGVVAVQGFIGKEFTGSPSPFAHWLKGKVISVEEKMIEFQFMVRKEMTNPVGMLHGGVISAMIDDCMGVNFFILGLEYFYPTITLNVEFFNPVSEGEIVIVKRKS